MAHSLNVCVLYIYIYILCGALYLGHESGESFADVARGRDRLDLHVGPKQLRRTSSTHNTNSQMRWKPTMTSSLDCQTSASCFNVSPS